MKVEFELWLEEWGMQKLQCGTAPGDGEVHVELAFGEAQGAEPTAKNQNR